MKQINSDFQAGSQKVVFDQIDATYPGGVQVDRETALERFPSGVIPAGSILVPYVCDTFKVINKTFTAPLLVGCIGVTAHDIVIDDIPLVSVVMAGTVRKDALPDKELAGLEFVKAVCPRLSFI